MDTLPIPLLIKIAIELPINDLLNLCETNRKNWNKICQNEIFWKNRAIQVLGFNTNEIPNKVDKKWYLEHAGVTYHKVGENDFEFVATNVKKIYCDEYITGLIDVNDNAFVYDGDDYVFLMKKAKEMTTLSNNETIILDTRGKTIYISGDGIDKVGKMVPLISKNKIEHIQGNYILANGLLYTYGAVINDEDDKMFYEGYMEIYKIDMNKIKYFKVYEHDYFIYITKNNDLYIAFDKDEHLLVANNVKYANVTHHGQKSNKLFYVFWIDHKDNLYLTFCDYRDIGKLKKMDKQFKNNYYFVVNNILKITITDKETYILTKNRDLYVNEKDNYIRLDNYEHVAENVKDVESSGNDVMILVIE